MIQSYNQGKKRKEEQEKRPRRHKRVIDIQDHTLYFEMKENPRPMY